MKHVFLALLMAASATSAQAQFSGTVTGTITTVDNRIDPYVTAGFAATVTGARQTGAFTSATRGLREILVRVCVELAFAPCVPAWTKTSSTSTYSVAWSGAAPPTRITVQVFAMSPDITSTVFQAFRPQFVWRITTAGDSDVSLGSSSRTAAPLTGNQTISIGFGASEVANAYLTVRETYGMLDAQVQPPSGSIRADTEDVDVFVNATPVPLTTFGGVALFDDEILLSPGTATGAPFTVAHEMGHVVEWHALDLGVAPISLPDYDCDGVVAPAWGDFTNECEKAAFQEGFAHLVGAMWMWVRSADPAGNPAVPRSLGAVNLETNSQNPTGGANPCTAALSAHERVVCNARALWDIVDEPASDGDSIQNRDLGEVIEVFRNYPRVCFPGFDNGCVNEVGSDGMNWEDYARNHKAVWGDSSAIDSIESQNGIGGSNNG